MQQAASGKVCDKLACKGPYLQELHAAELAARKAERSRVADSLARQVGLPGVLAVVVPANARPCVPLSPERLESFRHHLRRVIGDADQPEGTGHAPAAASEPWQNSVLPPVPVVHGCTTCRGRCCLGGAGHAFLRADRITEFWKDHPAWSPDAIEAEYLKFVSPTSYEDSCVYHSESGCTLPRTMRAEVCNTFLCEGLLEGLEQGAQAELYIAADGVEIQRVVRVDAEGRRLDLLPNESALSPGTP